MMKKLYKTKTIKVTHKSKPKVLLGTRPTTTFADIFEQQLQSDMNKFMLSEAYEEMMPKLTNPKVGCIRIYGTGGDMNSNFDSKELRKLYEPDKRNKKS